MSRENDGRFVLCFSRTRVKGRIVLNFDVGVALCLCGWRGQYLVVLLGIACDGALGAQMYNNLRGKWARVLSGPGLQKQNRVVL